jgi:hypothetical protein
VWQSRGLKRLIQVACNLEEFEVVETTLVSFKPSSNRFHLSPDIDEAFRLSGSRDFGIFEIGEHEIRFRAHKEIHTLLEMPGVSPPIFLSQSIPFVKGDGSIF